MKTKSLIVLGLVFGLFLTSCNKDKDEEDVYSTAFAENTPEENKAILEDVAVDMVAELEDLSNSESMEIMASFSEKSTTEEEILYAVFINESTLEGDVTGIMNQLKSVSEDPENYTELWAELEGTYAWNEGSGEWDYTEVSGSVTFEFPGKEGDATNTATLVFDGFAAVEFTNSDYETDATMGSELLSALSASLKYNNVEIASFTMSASYLDDGLPTSVQAAITIDDFSWSFDFSHSAYSSVSYTGSFKHNDQILMEEHFDASGNWSEDNVESGAVEDVLYNCNAYLQVMNIKVSGTVNAQLLAEEFISLEQEYSWDEQEDEEFNTALATAVNQYAQLVVINTDDNLKLAQAEAYAYEGDYGWDIDMRFIFGDDSKVDAETYLTEGFDSFLDDLEDFVDEINTKYNLDMDEV